MACLIALSTLEGVVWKVFATWGYSTLVMALACLTARLGALLDAAGEPYRDKYFEGEFIALFVPIDNYCLLAYTNDTKSQDLGQARNL